MKEFFDPFVPNAPFLYPLKTLENRKVFCCFQGVEKGCIGNEWVNQKALAKQNVLSFSYCYKHNCSLPCNPFSIICSSENIPK